MPYQGLAFGRHYTIGMVADGSTDDLPCLIDAFSKVFHVAAAEESGMVNRIAADKRSNDFHLASNFCEFSFYFRILQTPETKFRKIQFSPEPEKLRLLVEQKVFWKAKAISN